MWLCVAVKKKRERGLCTEPIGLQHKPPPEKRFIRFLFSAPGRRRRKGAAARRGRPGARRNGFSGDLPALLLDSQADGRRSPGVGASAMPPPKIPPPQTPASRPFPAVAMSQRGISLNGFRLSFERRFFAPALSGRAFRGLPPFGPVATATPSTATTAATATSATAVPLPGRALARVARSWSGPGPRKRKGLSVFDEKCMSFFRGSSVTSLPFREPSVSRIPTRPTAQARFSAIQTFSAAPSPAHVSGQVVTAAPITVASGQSSGLPWPGFRRGGGPGERCLLRGHL